MKIRENLQVIWKKPGFTMIEVLVALGIGGLLLTVLGSALYQGAVSSEKLYDSFIRRSDIGYACDYIREELGTADHIQRDGNYLHIINIRESKREAAKFHRITYITERGDLYRIAGKYKTYPDFSFHKGTIKGKNRLCSDIRDFSLTVEDGLIRIRIQGEDGFNREDFFALRCPVEELP